MVDRTVAATGTAAAARIQEEMGRRKVTEVDRDNAFKPFTSCARDHAGGLDGQTQFASTSEQGVLHETPSPPIIARFTR
jgi:hypothetical protein